MLDYILIVIWFVVLIKWADILVTGASSIAKKFGISSLVIGLTIVAFGTSAPELFVNVLSAVNGQTQLALGNIVGSNIANIFLILGAAALVYPVTAKSSTIYKEVPFSLLASFALFFLTYDMFFSWASENIITRGESLVLLLFFIIFFVYTFALSKSTPSETETLETWKKISSPMSFVYILWWLIGLWIWANLLVTSASNIAISFWVSEAVIGLTIIAFGTSLPELATSIIASLKKDTDIAIGNVVGSNIFNILLVLGTTGTISNIVVPETIITDIIIQIGSLILLIICLLFIGKRGTLTRIEGWVFLLLYFVYIGYLLQTQVL